MSAISSFYFDFSDTRKFNDLTSREYIVLETRTVRNVSDSRASILSGELNLVQGPFAQIGPGDKAKAKKFVDSASNHQINAAAGGGNSATTVKSDNQFHLDRQQPSSARFKSKVAVQLNKGSPSTVGQVVVHNDPKYPVNPSANKVRKFRFPLR